MNNNCPQIIQPPDGTSEAKTILVVEDLPESRNIMISYLKAGGYNVLVAVDVPTAMEQLNN
jgi:CheY-like chemotaxis protein